MVEQPQWKAYAGDAPTALHLFLQQHCKKTLAKADIEYSNFECFEGIYQSQVKLHCMGGLVLLGEPCEDEKLAQESAACAVLDFYALEVLDAVKNRPEKKQRPEPEKKQRPEKKRKVAHGTAASQALVKTGERQDYKSELARQLQATLRRALTKGDVQYTVTDVEGGWVQAAVTLVCVQGMQYAGAPAAESKAAEQLAAQQALLSKASWGTPLPAPRVLMPGKSVAKSDKDPKTQLVEAVQRLLRRACKKGDIVYHLHQESGEACWVTVTLACYDGRSCYGELGSTLKEAENSAASAALASLSEEIAALGPPIKKERTGRFSRVRRGPVASDPSDFGAGMLQ